MILNFTNSSKKKSLYISRVPAAIAVMVFSGLLAPHIVYAMDPPLNLEGHERQALEIADMEGDDARALANLRLAAAQKDAKANFLLGLRYDLGMGVEEDSSRALDYYQMAADLGDANAQAVIGRQYLVGGLLKKDDRLAVKYLELAAKQQCIMALVGLGDIYAAGKIVPQDLPRSFECWDSPAIRNYRDSEEQGLIKEINAKLAKGVLYSVAEFYEKGNDIVDQDISRAIEIYELLAEDGYAKAQYRLGKLYKNGHMVDQDFVKAFNYFWMAANLDYAPALEKLGDIWSDSKGDFSITVRNFAHMQLAEARLEQFHQERLRQSFKPGTTRARK